ncbi:hypothetical protein [Streptomyces xantholiticus]
MSSPGVTPDRRPGLTQERRPGLDRALRGLSCWWMIFPLILLTPVTALALGFPSVRERFGAVFGVAALISAVLPPAAGFALALAGGRRRARRRFAVMAGVGSVPVVFFLVFGVLLAECPSGHRC